MKTLQNDLTTIEQSKRLLELGVPKNSANHYYGKDGKLRYVDGTIPYSLLWETGCAPCWSVGRLIEIISKCMPSGIYTPKFRIDDNIIDTVLGAIELELDYGLDFSQLED